MSKFLDLDGLERYTYHVKNGLNENKNNILTLEEMNGSKNCITIKPLLQWNIPSGITITQDSDGVYVINGTTSVGYKYINIGSFAYTQNTKYYMHRSVIVINNSNVAYFYTGDNHLASSMANSYTYTLNGSVEVYLRLGLSNDTLTYTDAKLRPMIITQAVYDAGFTDYQPYSLTNSQLTNIVQSPATNSEIETMWNNS